MAIGTKMGSLKQLKKSLSKGAGTGAAWIKYIPQNGSLNVRFLEEPEHWVNYFEHYDQTLRKSYPCNGETSCPGCQAQVRKSSRYLANAVNNDDDRVIPLLLPRDLVNRLVVRYERNGTILDRDYELSRSGQGLDTVYDLDPEAPTRKNLAKYTSLDLMKVLTDAFNDVFGGGDEDEEEDEDYTPVYAAPASAVEDDEPVQRPKARKKSTAAPQAAVDTDEDDEPKAKPAMKNAAKKAAKKAPPEPTFERDDDDEKDEDDTDTSVAEASIDVDDDEGYDEESLRALPLGALRAVARDFGIDPKGMGADDIIAAILESGEPVEDDDDEIPF